MEELREKGRAAVNLPSQSGWNSCWLWGLGKARNGKRKSGGKKCNLCEPLKKGVTGKGGWSR